MRSDEDAAPDEQTSWRTDATLSGAQEDVPKRTRISAAWVGVSFGLVA